MNPRAASPSVIGPVRRRAGWVGNASARPSLVVLLSALSLSLVLLDRTGPVGSIITSVRAATRSALGPVESAADAAFGPLGDLGGGLGRGAALAEENARLRHALRRSGSEAARAEGLAAENARLARLLELRGPEGVEGVAARVVSLPAAGRGGATIVLDRGLANGIRPGMPVVAAAGLVGRVLEASPRQATVLPLADSASAVGVRVGDGGVSGVAEGLGGGRGLRLDLLDPASPARPGDLAVTSGLRFSRFPPGLPVGRVSARHHLTPLADVARLDVVKVLRWEPPR